MKKAFYKEIQMSKIDWIQQEIDGLKSQGLYNNIRTIGSPQGAWLTVDGKKVLNFCSNNYLGLANHPALVAASKKATDEMGVGPAAVRSIAGTMSLHVELGEASGTIQRRGSSNHFPKRIHCQPSHRPRLGWKRRCDLLG